MASLSKSLGSSRALDSRGPKVHLGKTTYYLTPHDIKCILEHRGHLWLSDSHILKYQTLLIEGSDVSLKKCSTLNPATFLPEESGGPLHSREETLTVLWALRPNLSGKPRLGAIHRWQLPGKRKD